MFINELNIGFDIIEKWLHDDDCIARAAARNVCQGRADIPITIIKKWLHDDDWHVRAVAMSACQGRTDIPITIIEAGLRDDYSDVRAAARNACRGRTDIPLTYMRSFNPPEHVYKKCINDVIVEAEIPSDAAVRGKKNCKCRASKARIVNVIGDIFDMKIGVSLYDKKTVYRVGDEIEIDDFDLSDEECSTGFHFFCTKEEAEYYKFL